MEKAKTDIVRSDTCAVPSGRRAVLLFTRAPLSEARTKRMAGLDFAGRVTLFTALTRRAIRTASETGFDLVVASDSNIPIFRDNAVHTIRQRGIDFGERLRNAIRDVFALGYDEVSVIGNDSPELQGATIRKSLTEKRSGALRICRAADGGVTLIALDRENSHGLLDLFADSRWETSDLFGDLVLGARCANIPVDVQDGGNDLDSVTDLIRLAGSQSAPRELQRLALLLCAVVRYGPDSNPYIRPHRRMLRTCRQKAPPSSPFHSTL